MSLSHSRAQHKVQMNYRQNQGRWPVTVVRGRLALTSKLKDSVKIINLQIPSRIMNSLKRGGFETPEGVLIADPACY